VRHSVGHETRARNIRNTDPGITTKDVDQIHNREHLWLIPGNNKSALAATIMSVTSTSITKLKDVLRPALKVDYNM